MAFLYRAYNSIDWYNTPDHITEPKSEPIISDMIEIQKFELQCMVFGVTIGANWIKCRDIALSIVHFRKNKNDHPGDV